MNTSNISLNSMREPVIMLKLVLIAFEHIIYVLYNSTYIINSYIIFQFRLPSNKCSTATY